MKTDPATVKSYLDDQSYDAIYISRRFKRKPGEDFKLIEEREAFDDRTFITEAVELMKFQMTTRVEIVRLVDVRTEDKPQAANTGEGAGIK